MGNLIIKGKGGAGNKLILQDQAGGAVLTTADSGASIANATLVTPTIASMANCTFPAGHILQVVNGTAQSEAYTQSTTFATMSLTAAITPIATSSKVFIICSTSGYNDSGNTQVSYYTIYRNSTDLGASNNNGFADIHQGSGGGHDVGTNICISTLDSPSTTSAITYGMYARVNNASYKTYWSMNGSKSDITVMEVAG